MIADSVSDNEVGASRWDVLFIFLTFSLKIKNLGDKEEKLCIKKLKKYGGRVLIKISMRHIIQVIF